MGTGIAFLTEGFILSTLKNLSNLTRDKADGEAIPVEELERIRKVFSLAIMDKQVDNHFKATDVVTVIDLLLKEWDEDGLPYKKIVKVLKKHNL